MADSLNETIEVQAWQDGASEYDVQVQNIGSGDVTFTEKSAGTILVASSGSESIPFGGVTNAKRVMIKAAAAGNVTWNGGSETLPVNGILVLSGDSSNTLTAVTFTDTSTSENEINYVVLG